MVALWLDEMRVIALFYVFPHDNKKVLILQIP